MAKNRDRSTLLRYPQHKKNKMKWDNPITFVTTYSQEFNLVKNITLPPPLYAGDATNKLAHLLHTLWSCKNLHSFWKSISTFMSNLTGNLTKLTPAVPLLSINLDIYPLNYRTIVAHILIAARLTITSLWKSTEAPNLSNVIAKLNIQAHFELMLAYKNYSTITFKKK